MKVITVLLLLSLYKESFSFRIHNDAENEIFLKTLSEDDQKLSSINNKIIAAIENVRDHFETGYPELGIPPLDPFQIGNVTLPFVDNKYLSLKMILSDIVIRGLKDFTIEKINMKVLTLTFEFDFRLPNLTFSTYFRTKGKVGSIVPILFLPRGSLETVVPNISFYGKLAMKIHNVEYLALKSLNIHMGLGKPQITFGNKFYNKISKTILSQFSDELLKGGLDTFNDMLNEIAFPIIDAILNKIRFRNYIMDENNTVN